MSPLSRDPGASLPPAEAPGLAGAGDGDGAIGRVATFAGAYSFGLWILSLAGAGTGEGGAG
jgi:hypothetical protein